MSGRRRRGEDEFAAGQPWLTDDDGHWPPEADDAGRWPPEDDDAGRWPPEDDDPWPDSPGREPGGAGRGRHSSPQGPPAGPGGWEPTGRVPRQAGPHGRPHPGTSPGWEEPGWGDPEHEDRFALRPEPDAPPSRPAAPWDPEPPAGDPYPASPPRDSRPGDPYPVSPGRDGLPGDRYAAPPGREPASRNRSRTGPGRPARYDDAGGHYGDPGGWDREPAGQYGVLGGRDTGPDDWDRDLPDRDAGLGGRYRDPAASYGDPGDPGGPAGQPGDRSRGYGDPREWPDAPSGRRPDPRGGYAGAGDGYPPPDHGTGGYAGAGSRRAGPGGDDYPGEYAVRRPRRPGPAYGPGGRDTARGTGAETDDPGWDDEDGYQDKGWPFGGDGDGDSGGRPRRKRRGRWAGPSSLLIVAAIILIPLIAGGIYAYRVISAHYDPPNYSGDGTGTIVFEVKPGDNSQTVGDRLAADGVVASSRALVLAAEHSSNANELQPGYYRLHKHMNAQLAWNLLLSPSARVQLKVTIPEGWRVSQIVAALGKQSGIPASDYTKALKDPKALGLPSYAKGNPEGYLFPATYDIQPHMSATSVLRAMVNAFNQEAAKVNLPKAAARGHLTPAEVVVVASLAQAEGGKDSDFPKITRVIYNRLNDHMPLDLDSTVLYALHTYGILASSQQLKVKSPYNTYTHQGLPPAPIDSPGAAAIQAALHPASGNWLYFVTVNPKTKQTDFTSSPAVFQQLKNELQRNLAHGG